MARTETSFNTEAKRLGNTQLPFVQILRSVPDKTELNTSQNASACLVIYFFSYRYHFVWRLLRWLSLRMEIEIKITPVVSKCFEIFGAIGTINWKLAAARSLPFVKRLIKKYLVSELFYCLCGSSLLTPFLFFACFEIPFCFSGDWIGEGVNWRIPYHYITLTNSRLHRKQTIKDKNCWLHNLYQVINR